MYSLCTYKNVTKPTVIAHTALKDWLYSIRQSPYSDLIIQARKGQVDYETTKMSLPCTTFNFMYDGYKKNVNTLSSTGLLYIDIDSNEFDITLLDRNKIYACYQSFGGSGWVVLARIDGVTLNNFHASYSYVVEDLGLSLFVDTQAIKPSQFSILSYDEDLFINESCFVYQAVEVTSPRTDVKMKKEKAYTLVGEEKAGIRFNNLDDFSPVEDIYSVDWDGKEYVNCFIPIKKRETGQRNSFLLGYCSNFVVLNPELSRDAVVSILDRVNQIACNEPVNLNQIRKIVESVFKYKEEGTLKSTPFRMKRKFFFNERDGKISKSEKWNIINQELSNKRKQESLQKLNDILADWDFGKLGKITQAAVYKNHPISSKTVEKYWFHFKFYIRELNLDFKNSIHD